MNKKLEKWLITIVYYLAVIIEWANIVLFMAAMGYEFNIDIYMKIREFPQIATIYYISAAIDIILFWILAIIFRKKDDTKNTLVTVCCCLVQIALLMYKIKL